MGFLFFRNVARQMMIRFAIRLILSMHKALVLGVFLINLCLVGSAALAQSPPKAELSLDQARRLAVLALQSGKPDLAIRLSKGLLKADRRDPIAYYVIARSYAGLNQANLARRAATRAYRFSDNDPARFRAGQLAAQMAFAENKPSLAQVWLRRTALYAPSDKEEALVARDYRVLRQLNPWTLGLRTDLRPTQNINNGADSALQVIDGVPVTGFLSGSAQALSGVIGVVDLTSSYRLRANKSSSTTLGGRIYVQRVRLSGDAMALAPTVSNSDFGSTHGEVSLGHAFAVGPKGKGGTASVNMAFGEAWFGGQRNYRFGRLQGERVWKLDGGRTRVSLGASVETRGKVRFATSDADIFGLNGGFKRALGNGDTLSVSLALRDTQSLRDNGTYRSASLRASYAFGKAIGPAHLTAGLVLGYSDYPNYRSAGLFVVPGGRQDQSLYGDISLFFDKITYAGFAPMLRFRAGRKSSNDSRFSTRDVSLTLSFQSTF